MRKKLGLKDVICVTTRDGLVNVIAADNGDKIAQIYGDAYRWKRSHLDYDIQADLVEYITSNGERTLVI